MAQKLEFDLLARDRISGPTKDAGRSMDLAALAAEGLAKALAAQRRAAAESGAASVTLAKADQLLKDAEDEAIAKYVEADIALRREAAAKRDAAKAGAGLTASLGPLASGMGALVGAGVILSPVIAAVGLGTAGFGLAAAGTIGPVLKASQSAKGLAGSWSKLTAEQQQAALSALQVKQDFAGFQKALAPTVLADFGEAARFAGHMLHDLQPVSLATGKALGGLLGQVDAEFQSRQWQQFFGYLARQAGPDVRLLGNLLVSLAGDLPPLLESLQPAAQAVLMLGTDAAQAARPVADLLHTITSGIASSYSADSPLKRIDRDIRGVILHIPGLSKLVPSLDGIENSSGGAARGTSALGTASRRTTMAIAVQAAAAAKLTTSLDALISPLLQLEGDQVSWRQAQQAATAAVKANSHSLDGNSASALAARQAIIQATGATVKYADDQVTTRHNLAGATSAIESQIHWLQAHAGKSKIAADEIAALRAELAKLRAEASKPIVQTFISEFMSTGQSRGSVSGGIAPGMRRAASGWLVPGSPALGDYFPALLKGGEAVVPPELVPPIAPYLRAHGVPGFAGGMVPSHGGGGTQTVRVEGALEIDLKLNGAQIDKIRVAFIKGGGTEQATGMEIKRHVQPRARLNG